MFQLPVADYARIRIEGVFREWPRLFFTLLIVFLVRESFATVLYWPDICKNSTLQLTNKSNQPFYFWLQKFNPELEYEVPYEIEGNSTLNIQISKENILERNSILHFVDSNSIQLNYSCFAQRFTANNVEGGVSRFRVKSKLRPKLIMQNLSRSINVVNVNYYNSFQKLIMTETLQLDINELVTHRLASLAELAFVEVETMKRLSLFALDDQSQLNPASHRPIHIPLSTEPKASYFLVGPRDGEDDTFVVKILDPKLISQARNLIHSSENEKIVFAKIELSPENPFNRNFNSRSKSLWSWSPSEVTGFGDLASTACNGHPQAVEDRAEAWVQQIGKICFWDYRLKRELNEKEVSTGQLEP